MEGARCYRAVTGMPFASADAANRAVMGSAYVFQALCWQVRDPGLVEPHADWDGEEISRGEMTSRAARCRSTQDSG